MTSTSGLYSKYIRNHPTVAPKVAPITENNEVGNVENITQQWKIVSRQWLEWLGKGDSSSPSTVPLLPTKSLKSVIGNTNTNGTQKDFLAWPQSSPFQLNIGTPASLDTEFFSKIPTVFVKQTGEIVNELKQWKQLNTLIPPTKVVSSVLLDQIVKLWENEALSVKNVRIQMIQAYQSLWKFHTTLNQMMAQTDPVRFQTDLQTWFQSIDFTSTVQSLAGLSQVVETEGVKLRGDQIELFQNYLNQFVQFFQQQLRPTTSSYESSRYIGTGGQYYTQQSYPPQLYYDSRPMMPNQGRVQRERHQLESTMTQQKNLFQQVLSLYPGMILSWWLVEMQLDLCLAVRFWSAFCEVCANQDTPWKFIYAWNASQWKQRYEVFQSISLTFLHTDAFNTAFTEKYKTIQNQSWRNLSSYIPSNQNAKNKKNANGNANGNANVKVNGSKNGNRQLFWYDMMEQNGMTTQPQWNEVWTWGGWIIPEKVAKPVSWESTMVVSSWRAWEQRVLRKLSSQEVAKNKKEKMDLSQEDRLNTMLRWKNDATANTNASAGLEAWIQAVQQWKKSILLWKQEYDSANEKNQEALWKTFEGLVEKVSGIQQAWWVLYQQIPVGTIESRRYWNYWWDLQRFYIQYFYYLGTPEQEKALYENAFRYGYDLEKKVGKFSAEGLQYLTLATKQAPPAIKKGLMGLMKESSGALTKANDGSQDWVYVFQEKTVPVLRSLDLQSLWSPSWNFRKYWVSLYEYLGVWDRKKGEPTETIMVPVRVMGNAEYWLSVWDLWKNIEIRNGNAHLGGFPGVATPEGQLPVFYNFGALARAMLAPAPRSRVRGQESAFVRELPADWAQLWRVGNLRPVRVLCFSQDGVDSGLWEVLRMPDLNPRGVKAQPQQLVVSAGRAHSLVWVSWIARLLIGQQMPLSGNATQIDLRTPLTGKQQSQRKRGGATQKGMPWKDMALSVLTATQEYLKTQEDRLGLSPADRRVVETGETFFRIEEEGTVQLGGNGGVKTVRRWIVESEKTGKAHMVKQ